MKKTIALLLIFVIALSVASCGKPSQEEKTETEKETVSAVSAAVSDTETAEAESEPALTVETETEAPQTEQTTLAETETETELITEEETEVPQTEEITETEEPETEEMTETEAPADDVVIYNVCAAMSETGSTADDSFLKIINGKSFDYYSSADNSVANIKITLIRSTTGSFEIRDGVLYCTSEKINFRTEFEKESDRTTVLLLLESSKNSGSFTTDQYNYVKKIYSKEGYSVTLEELKTDNPAGIHPASNYRFVINNGIAYQTYTKEDGNAEISFDYYYDTGTIKEAKFVYETGITKFAEFYENGQQKHRIATSADGTVIEEYYFDEDGNLQSAP